jgi:Tfp pilus assembly protein PilF
MCLGIALFHLGDTDNATQAHKRAMQLDSTEAMVHLNYAACLANAGKVDEAKAAFNTYNASKKQQDDTTTTGSGSMQDNHDESDDPSVKQLAQQLQSILHV